MPYPLSLVNPGLTPTLTTIGAAGATNSITAVAHDAPGIWADTTLGYTTSGLTGTNTFAGMTTDVAIGTSGGAGC